MVYELGEWLVWWEYKWEDDHSILGEGQGLTDSCSLHSHRSLCLRGDCQARSQNQPNLARALTIKAGNQAKIREPGQKSREPERSTAESTACTIGKVGRFDHLSAFGCSKHLANRGQLDLVRVPPDPTTKIFTTFMGRRTWRYNGTWQERKWKIKWDNAPDCTQIYTNFIQGQ
jgi:hypothetical protein